MISDRSPFYVAFRSNLGLVVLSTDAYDGKGEQYLLTLSPTEAVNLGTALADIGKQNGGVMT
jgi:hypothetical protein